MTFILLRRAKSFTPFVNPHFLSRPCSNSSGTWPTISDKNEPMQREKRDVGSTNYDRSQYLWPLLSRNDAQTSEYKIQLVDDETWRVSTGLAGAWRSSNQTNALRNEAANEERSNNEDPDFDEIEDMRIRGNLFYKLDKDSKEYEEYNYDFHRRKSSKSKVNQKESKKKENSASVTEKSTKNRQQPPPPSVSRPRQDLERTRCVESYPNGTNSKENVSRNSQQPTLESTKNRGERKINKKKETSTDHAFGSERRMLKDEKNYNLKPPLNEVNGFNVEKKQRTPTFNQLTAPYHEPFCLDIYISKASVRACIVHRATSNVVVVAHSISKDLKFDLGSTRNATACAAVGEVLAQRALADDIHNVVYTPRRGEKLEGKLQIVLQSIIKKGVDVKVKIKQRKFKKSGIVPKA